MCPRRGVLSFLSSSSSSAIHLSRGVNLAFHYCTCGGFPPKSGAPSEAGRWQAAEQHMLQDLLPSSTEPLDKSPAGGEVYDGLSDTPMYNERIDQSRPRFYIFT